MPNTLAFGLSHPRTDTHLAASGEEEAPVLIPARSTPMAAPDGNTPYVSTRAADSVRAFVRYSGTVTGATLVWWLLQDGVWYRAATDTLDPANGNEVLDMTLLGTHTAFTAQLSAVAGGGTVEVRVLGVF